MLVETTLVAHHVVEIGVSKLFRLLLRVVELCGRLFELLLLLTERHCIRNALLRNRA